MALAAIALAAALLPLAPQPASPFPKIETDAVTVRDVAPGIEYGEYVMRTADGPLSVHVLGVDLHDPAVRIGTALAGERMLSSGETVSSMAYRTGAVAGVNGDYFDINQTNQPLNILIENGKFVRPPMHRWAIAFDRSGAPSFSEFTLELTATLAQGTLPLITINDWPPPGGRAVLLTPDYGPLHPAQNVTEFTLAPTTGSPPFATYRVTGIADNTAAQPPGYYLALGINAYGSVPLPDTGEAVTVSADASPPLEGLRSAIGGGPLLVKNGAWYADPDGPSKGEFATHMPATAVAVTRSGSLVLLEIDGRQPEVSIGVLQPQLASLLIAFGAVTAMQFDGGGSSTIVARLPGDDAARVQNSPSDGAERRVADALLIYSDAPHGAPANISSFPQAVRAVPGASVRLRTAITDAGGHAIHDCHCTVRMQVAPADAGTLDGDTFVAGLRPIDGFIRVSAGPLRAQIPVHVMNAIAHTQVIADRSTVRPGETMQVRVRAMDAGGYAIALPAQLPWRTDAGHIDAAGTFVAGAHDARVSVRIGDVNATGVITVGEHDMDLDLARFSTFATSPHGGPGGLDLNTSCTGCITLRYDFTGDERAAYVNAPLALPEGALGVSAGVYGDGNGETLRLAVDNAINERFLYTLAAVDWHGWRHVEFRFPQGLPQPLTLKALYVIDRVGPQPPVRAAGAVSLRNVHVILAGSAQNVPK